MRELLKNPFYIYGNLFYLFFLSRVYSLCSSQPYCFPQVFLALFWVLIAMLFSCVPYNCLLIFPDLKFTLNDKTYREAHINRINPGVIKPAALRMPRLMPDWFQDLLREPRRCLSLARGLSSQEAPNALQRSNCSALGSGWCLATTRGCLALVRPVCFSGIEGTVGLRGMGLEVN